MSNEKQVLDESLKTSCVEPFRNLPTSSVKSKDLSTSEGDTKDVVERNSDSITQDRSSPDEISFQFLTFKTELATEPIWPDGIPPDIIPKVPDFQQYDDPLDWALPRKNFMTYMACSVNAIAAYAAGSYEAPADILTAKWHLSPEVYNVGLAVFVVGFALAPMILAPFSEINGRRPVFIASGIVFVICQMWSGLSPNFGSMLASRFLGGVGGSTFSTMVGGILADIWATKDRNTAMVIFAGATLFGTGLGPLVSGVVAQHLDWRWVFYIQIMTSGLLVSLVTFFFKETRGSVLLSRKAKMMNDYYDKLDAAGAIGVFVPEAEVALVAEGARTPPVPANEHAKQATDEKSSTTKVARLRYRVKSDEERASLLKMISISLYRPMHMLVTEPVVFWFSMWISLAWGVLYLFFGGVPLVFEVSYNFAVEQRGFVFASQCICAIISTVLSIYQEKWGMKYFPERIGGSPEGRLYFVCVEAALFPAGLFMFGWTCFPNVHWIAPTIAIGIATMGIFSVFLGVFNYSADVYRIYASSALAATGLCRNLLAGGFSMATNPMFENLGFQAANSLLGGVATALTFVPIVLIFFGPRIRSRSKIARSFLSEEEREQLEQRKKHKKPKDIETGHTQKN